MSERKRSRVTHMTSRRRSALLAAKTPKQRITTILATLMPSAGVRRPRMSRFGGKATTTLRRGPLSNHVSPFRNECFGGDACGGRVSRVVPYARS